MDEEDELAMRVKACFEGLTYEQLEEAGVKNAGFYQVFGKVIRETFLALQEREPDLDFDSYAKCLILSAVTGLEAYGHFEDLHQKN
jgi:hypothetical protein